ncbi:MFS transporter, CP family, cyanate transporter [Paramicrobacterium humi]|uniref:MFS transporter, CP family, cyanate transporter n=1 Tax=Paramicrobacterium humi TaxID=640635 RepID=A0A1H4PKD4_9MICO|nr:MFS transporter [Microbacterium humi]SEC07718.1 MFS transporter, CP family, cyanate transporter [Microbacterium humi]
MPFERRLPLWAGRSFALVGIVLVAVNLRTAVAALSPIYGLVDADLHGGSFGLGLLGMLPPLCFAVFGIVTPALSRRFGLEGLLIGAIVVMVGGHLLRGLASGFGILVLGSVLCFAAIGAGNVLLPPLVKKYFSDRIGQLTALYAVVMSASTFVPALLAVPMAHAASWQFSLGIWAACAVVALAPWLVVLARARRARRLDPAVTVATERGVGRIIHSRTAWAIMTIFAVSSSTAYSCFAWLPAVLADTAGVSPTAGGALLSLFGFRGLPAAIIMPILATRVRRTGLLAWAGVAFIIVGIGGLLLAPEVLPWLWVALLGSGPLLFPLALTLINTRSRSPHTAIAVSGFVQGIGYVIAALFPLLVGVLRDVTGGWTASLVLLLAAATPAVWAGIVLGAGRTVDDEIGAR